MKKKGSGILYMLFFKIVLIPNTSVFNKGLATKHCQGT